MSERSFRVLVKKYEKLRDPLILDELCNLLIAGFSREKFGSLLKKYPSFPNDLGPNKYIHQSKEYIERCINRAIHLNLHKTKNSNILDIGSGFGWFALICTKLGHNCIGLDVDNEPLYNESFSILGLKRYIHRIMPFQPLPAFDELFDLITCFQICFNLYPDHYDWGPGEWAYFMHNLGYYGCNDTLNLLIEFNFHAADIHHGSYYSPLMKRWLLENGFMILPKGKVFFSSPKGNLPFKDYMESLVREDLTIEKGC